MISLSIYNSFFSLFNSIEFLKFNSNSEKTSRTLYHDRIPLTTPHHQMSILLQPPANILPSLLTGLADIEDSGGPSLRPPGYPDHWATLGSLWVGNEYNVQRRQV